MSEENTPEDLDDYGDPVDSNGDPWEEEEPVG